MNGILWWQTLHYYIKQFVYSGSTLRSNSIEEDQNTSGYTAWTIIFCTSGALLFLENFLTILVILQVPKPEDKTNVIISILAITDCLPGFIMIIGVEIYFWSIPYSTACAIIRILWITPPLTWIIQRIKHAILLWAVKYTTASFNMWKHYIIGMLW